MTGSHRKKEANATNLEPRKLVEFTAQDEADDRSIKRHAVRAEMGFKHSAMNDRAPAFQKGKSK